MKKQILKFAVLMALPVLFSIQSCKKDNENTSTATLGSAFVVGKINGNLNLLSGEKDPVAGIKVIARVNMSDLVTSGSAPANAVKVYEATTDADGNFTIKLDAGNKPMNVTVSFPAKANLEQTKEDGAKEVMEYTVNSATRNITVYKGETKTENANYTFVPEIPMGLMTVKGKVKFRNDMCETGDDQLHDAPSGTVIVISWMSDGSMAYDREIEVKVDGNGNYSATLETKESSKNIKIKGRKFFANRKEKDGSDCVTKSDYGYVHGSQNVGLNKGETTISNLEFN
ncbi:MAG: hypothetical protein KF882_00705 [Bacteroidia bacterium]|nr:hypothetical protein [Bacteroidia bacterium]MCO5252913.1 hypothetical protein [Bacteroidota bacterium]